MIKGGITPEKYRLFLALSDSHGKKEVSHVLTVCRSIYADGIQGQGGDELKKTSELIDLLSQVLLIDLYKQKNTHKKMKKEVSFDDVAYLVYDSTIKDAKHQLKRVKVHKNPLFTAQAEIAEVVGWLTLLKLALHYNIRNNSNPFLKKELTRNVLTSITGTIKKHKMGIPLQTDLLSIGSNSLYFSPDHMVEILAGKLLKLNPESKIEDVMDFIRKEVLVGLKGEKHQTLKGVKQHVANGLQSIPTQQGVNSGRLDRGRSPSRLVEAEKKCEDEGPINDSSVHFFP
ncbi:hypothetical protein [Piscirickettsia litoralis]|uniref:Uncharacterized protein n=1 Tax=Piscirickettsia litoralis TaxID=1891921 RepID=A0ABX3A0Q0_9GAMM|nr:hypothetical protein [Piscirickettsia litoralis]ODN42373.1 hypothetical protein BGC07_04780 [Piscirickettsia litoralis]